MLILIAASDLILILINYFRKLQLPISVNLTAWRKRIIWKVKTVQTRVITFYIRFHHTLLI
jgi:hypothetical protein